ncbi:MAG TPA: dihydroorotate dehydrogenase-like protein [Candidatus Hydrogenedens sp.]|nr:dihydroorotate dehydrogenase-like protein [Candidatus Hydrogenedens sp.]HOL19238.1 dihydroorotate dehydrogenase-like protein [Candidatus Hydrogenedens sp.]HPP58935.1 dihydroorotate dehydrogenase-like protein [Candidatus Hydrogenedens sp.]
MADLTTNYLGIKLKNPLVVSPSPLCDNIDNIKRMEDRGASAIVLHSLFEEQITLLSHELDSNLSYGTESFAEAITYFPDVGDFRMGPDAYLEHIQKAKQAVSIPIMGSLNGVSKGGWVEYAKKIQDAGADALELNIYFIPTDPNMTSDYVSNMYVDLVKEIRKEVTIPLAVKIGPYFSSLPNVAKRLAEAGANALVFFNRFYQPDFDLDNLEVVPHINLSTSNTLLLRLRWVAILYGRIPIDFAITGGVHTAEDVIKSMMAGAKVAMMTSALLKYGIPHLTTVLKKLEQWLNEHEYDSIEIMQGSMSQKSVTEPTAFERANYMHALTRYTAGS